MDPIIKLLSSPRINVSEMKSVFGTGAMVKTLGSKKYQLEVAKTISHQDITGEPLDEAIVSFYGIVEDISGNGDIDSKLAIAIALTKSPAVIKYANQMMRKACFSGEKKENSAQTEWIGQNQSEVGIPTSESIQPIEYKTPEMGQSGQNHSEVGIPTSDSIQPNGINLYKIDEISFPEGSKVKKSRKDVNDFLIKCINQNLHEFKEDAMVNVNDMIASTGITNKPVKHWYENASSKAYIAAVMQQTNKPYEKVYLATKGGTLKQGTWANIYVAIEIARWIDPYFSVMVNDIFLRVITGDLTLIGDVLTIHDTRNKTKTNALSTAPGDDTQTRQLTVTSIEVDTMTAEQIDAQVKINASQAAFNHKLMRAIDYSRPVTRGELMHRDRETGILVINKSAVNKTNVERALVTLYPEMFYGDNITTMHDLIEELWFKIVTLENTIAKFSSAEETKQAEGGSQQVTEQRTIIKQLRVHIEHLTTIHRLKPLIDSLAKPRSKTSDQNEPNIGVIHDLLLDVFSGGKISQDVINSLNWQMTSKLGCEFKTHVDLRNLVSVVSDMADIFRADLTTREFNPIVPKEFGNLYNQQDISMQSEWSPVYYHSVLADVDMPAQDYSFDDQYSESDAVSVAGSSSVASCSTDSSIGDDAYSAVSIHVAKPKRSNAPSRARVVKRAHELGDDLRASILKVLEDRVNITQPVVMKSRDEQVLNLYYGQEGYAFKIVPRVIGTIPRVILAVSLGDILDAGAFHIRPAGQITLSPGVISQKILSVLAAANIIGGHPMGSAIFTLTRDYTTSGKSPLVALIRTIITSIGAQFVTTITYPSDPLGQSWNIVTPRELNL